MADNWYIVLELEFDPPVEDEALIAERIVEKSKFWSGKFNDFKMGPQYRTWQQSIPQIKKDMIGPDNIRRQLAAEACEAVYGKVDKTLKQLSLKGYITSDECDKLAKKEKISIDVIKKRAAALKIKLTESTGADYQAVYDKYYKNKPQGTAVYEGAKNSLATFGVNNLYEFLYLGYDVKDASKLPCATLCERAAEKKKKEFFKTDSISGTGSKLCGLCEVAFKSEASKAQYDELLQYSERKAVLDAAKYLAEVSGEIGAEQCGNFVNQLAKLLRDPKLAEDVFTAFCKIEKITFSLASSVGNRSGIKICRCGCVNDVSDGRKVCASCGLELVVKCPKCHTEHDNNVRVCKCGFRFENIDRAVALCEQAEIAVSALDLKVARIHLDDAEKYWEGCPEAEEIRKKLVDAERRATPELTAMEKARKARLFTEVKVRYDRLRKMFDKYSDIIIEKEADEAIAMAKEIFEKAKKAKSESEIMELTYRAYEVCADLPGLQDLIPPPTQVSGFHVSANGKTRQNVVTWNASGDKSVKYVVTRSTSGWMQRPEDGKTIYEGSSSSYADEDILPGVVYFYNVFARRADKLSPGAKGVFTETVNLFEISGVSVAAADSSLKISWDTIPQNAEAEILRVSGNGLEVRIRTGSSDGCLLSDLKNDTNYRFRVRLAYVVSGEKKYTDGEIVEGIPVPAPMPVDYLRLKAGDGDVFDAIWSRKDRSIGAVRLYASAKRPDLAPGSVVGVSAVEKTMEPVQLLPLSPEAGRDLHPGEEGAAFRVKKSENLFVSAFTVRSGSAVYGCSARAGESDRVKIRDVRTVNGRINIYIDPPKNASSFTVLCRHDRFPIDINDQEAAKKVISVSQYRIENAIILDAPEENKYYFSVFAEVMHDGIKEMTDGADHLFDNSAKVSITYSISVKSRFFGESQVIMGFEADQRKFRLPDIDVMSAVGNTPMFRSSAKLFFSIPAQTVEGSVQIKIPMPKSLPKNTFIKAFFRDEADQNRNQLRLDVKSNYKIN